MKAFRDAFARSLAWNLADLIVGLLRLAIVLGLIAGGIYAAWRVGFFNPPDAQGRLVPPATITKGHK